MPERELFDQLSEIEGEGARIGFLDDLERRLVAARTDVGPAIPTDHMIEGVVPMPDKPITRRRVPLFIAAAAAIVVVVALVAILGGDDDAPSDTDVIAEPDATESDTDAVESDESETDAVEDDTSEALDVASALAVADEWMQALAAVDLDRFRSLHSADAQVTGTVFEPGAAGGPLDDPDVAETYWNGWDARRFYDERWGITPDPGVCEPANDGGFECISLVPAFGPETEPFRETRYRLQVSADRVTSVSISSAFVDSAGDLVGGAPQFFLPAALDVEGTPPGQACIDIDFNSIECADEIGEYWIAHFRQFVPEALVVPE